MKKIIFSVLIVFIIVLFFFFPQTVKTGVQDGLLLWFHGLIPSLLPFMFLNQIVIRFGLSDTIAKMFLPFSKLLKLDTSCAYPIMSGLLFGCPSCAIACDLLVSRGQISKDEAEFCVCAFNQIGPSFIIFYLCFGILQDVPYRFLIPVIFYGTLFLSSLLLRFTLFGKMGQKSRRTKHFAPAVKNPYAALDEAIARSVGTLIKLCGYLILTSILTAFCERFLPSALSILTVLSEVTYGTNQISSLSWDYHKTLLFCVILIVFGGVSAIVQTLGVISTDFLSAKRYLSAKIISVGIAVCTAQLVFLLLFLVGSSVAVHNLLDVFR